MATLVLGGIGAAIGSLVPGGWMLGYSIGASIGGVIDELNSIPSQEVGKLSDLRVSGSAYGAPLPRGWGRFRVGGNVVWVADDATGNHLVEHKESNGGGKGGGPRVTSYWYSASFGVAFCAGTATFPDGTQQTRNHRIKRIWFDDQLVWTLGGSANKISAVTTLAGTETQNPPGLVVAHEGVAPGALPANRGLVAAFFEDIDLGDFGNRIPAISAEIETDAVTLGDVLADLCRSAGLAAAQVDAAAVAIPLPGLVLADLAAPLDAIEPLCEFFAVDSVEADGKIRFVARGTSAPVAVSPDDLGAASGTRPSPRLRWSRKPATDLPGRVELSYYDRDRDFQQSMQADVRQSVLAPGVQSLSLPLSLTADEAKRGAQRKLDSAWAGGAELEFSLPPQFLSLIPTDVALVPFAGGTTRARLVSVEFAPVGEVRCRAVTDGATVADQTGGGATGGVAAPPPAAVVPTVFRVWSGRELRDEDQTSPGFYVAASGDSGWQGGTVFWSPDGVTWVDGGTVRGRSAFGTATTALGSAGAVAGAYDVTNSVAVDVAPSGQTLASATAVEVESGRNHVLLGAEVVGVRVASLTGPGAYSLSNLRRGARGTPLTGHAAGELCVLLSDAVARVSVAESYIGATLQVKVVSPGQSLADVTARPVTIAARTPTAVETVAGQLLRPYLLAAPVVVSSGLGVLGYTTFDASASLPTGAAAALIEVEFDHLSGGMDTALRRVILRRDATAPDIFAVRAGGSSGQRYPGAVQVLVPVTASRTFQFTRTAAFSDLCTIRLLGYWGTG